MISPFYNAEWSDHFWRRIDTGSIYSTKIKGYVGADEEAYLAWAAKLIANVPSHVEGDLVALVTPTVSDEADLKATVLRLYPQGWMGEADRYVPVALVRERLEAADLWNATAVALVSNPAMMLKVMTLKDGLDPTDPQVIELLQAVGADPEQILAP
jgi:hypothetical protein